MINLLSSSAKKKLWNEYRIRLGILIFAAIALLELFTVTLFLFPYYTLHSSNAALANDLEERKKLLPDQNKSINAEVQAVKTDLTLLKPGAKKNDALPAQLLADIVSVKSKGITINNWAYARSGDAVSIQLSGIAATRDDILSFKNELDKNPLFTVARSGDYLIKKTNISFSITLTMK